MDNFYFTFGQDHRTTDGYPMRDHWVRVVAHSWVYARAIFWRFFSTPRMERGGPCWASQYTEEKFNPEYFPAGEYQVLQEEDFIEQLVDALLKEREEADK